VSTLHTADGRLRTPVRLLVGSLLIVVAATLTTVAVAPFGESRLLLVTASGFGTTLGVLFVARTIDRRTWADLGLDLNRRWAVDLLAGLVLGVLLMAGVFLTQLAAGWARVAQAGVPELVGWFGTLALFLVVGFYEELFVRGWLLTNVAEGFSWLGERLATAIAVFASAAVFGVLHFANPNATLASTLGITAAGVFLGWAFVRTASLALPVGVHITWNFAQGSLFGFPVSGIGTPATVVETVVTGPTLLTGGEFGPEAGLVGLGASVVGTLAVSTYVRFRGVPTLTEALAWTTVPELLSGSGDESAEDGEWR
jgi:membrane protease YdiL (CAAX protease family)